MISGEDTTGRIRWWFGNDNPPQKHTATGYQLPNLTSLCDSGRSITPE